MEQKLDQLMDSLGGFGNLPGARELVIIVVTIIVALVIRLLFASIVHRLTRKTTSDIDDRIVTALRGPVFYSIVLIGVGLAIGESSLSDTARYVIRGSMITVVALMWAIAAMRIGTALLDALSRQVDRLQWLQPQTMPLFDMILKVVVVGGFLYFVCIAWKIPLASWLTSAGIVGIAVGFAARDTLANLFSGIFIIADAPYKVGDYVNLDNNVRGEVLEIGMRSTRLLTRDDLEVTVPNAVIGNAQIINETGGPHEKMRVRVKVSVAYGSDVDRVEEVLLGCVEGVEHLAPSPAPRVRFRQFGDSGLAFELLAWIDRPVYRGRVLHALNRAVYISLNAAGIEIPYTKIDLYMKEYSSPAA